MPLRRSRLIIAVLVAVLLVLLAVAATPHRVNGLRPYIADKVTASTGRSFAIRGDLEVRLLWHPRVIANDVELGSATWSRDPQMAKIARADLELHWSSLLLGRLAFRHIGLSQPAFVLEKNREGVPNWQFGKTEPSAPPDIDRLVIDRGSLVYRDPGIDTDLKVAVDSEGGQAGKPAMLKVNGDGRFKGMPLKLDGTVGGLLSLTDADQPYPIRLSGTIGQTTAAAEGTLLNPRALKGEDIRFRLEGADLAQLFPLAGVPIPPTPPYKLSGHLSHRGDLWLFRGFKGKVGGSDLSGDLSIDRGKKPQFISANLNSDMLALKDLGGLIGGSRGDRPAPKQPAGKALPTEPFRLEKLRVADAEVRFTGKRVVTESLPIDAMTVHATLKDGLLKLDPLNFSIGKGEVASTIAMDARQQLIGTQADIRVKHLRLDDLFPASPINQNKKVNTGTLGGRAQLRTTGNSIADMLGSASGETALILNGGSISELVVRLSNLDIANSLGLLLTGDRQVRLRCMVAQLNAVDGNFRVQTLVADTPQMLIGGSGNVNMKEERLNLRLVSQAKGFSLAALRGPIDLTGTFKNPNARPEVGQVAGRGALAALLGAATAGVGALIPLVEFGGAADADCQGLIEKAQQSADVQAEDTGKAGQGARK